MGVQFGCSPTPFKELMQGYQGGENRVAGDLVVPYAMSIYNFGFSFTLFYPCFFSFG